MGCYGIGINRIMASAVELYHDDNGIVWPISIAPFEVLITPVNQDDLAVSQAAETIYTGLQEAGIEVLLDDRDLRGGPKFKDADLIGIPIRVTVGKKSVAEGNIEIKLRGESEINKAPIAEAAQHVVKLVQSLKDRLSL
jgi:prolyl-tRNA synthetase